MIKIELNKGRIETWTVHSPVSVEPCCRSETSVGFCGLQTHAKN